MNASLSRILSMTATEFGRLGKKQQHKKAAEALRSFHETSSPSTLRLYRRVEEWLQLPLIDETSFPALSDRYQLHLHQAEVSWKEHNLLETFRVQDRPSTASILPVHLYLDHLRSAHNIGSILRTMEAFRFSMVFFQHDTLYNNPTKIKKTSMHTYDKIPCQKIQSFQELPRPLIALETDPLADSVFDFSFPSTFTLMVGNEEYGLSKEALSQRDAIVSIPLFGFKNSLNVAAAFAIAAGVISHQLRKN